MAASKAGRSLKPAARFRRGGRDRTRLPGNPAAPRRNGPGCKRSATAPEPAAAGAIDASCGRLPGLAKHPLAAETKVDEIRRGELTQTTLAAVPSPVAGSEAHSGRPDRGGQRQQFRRLVKQPAERQGHRRTLTSRYPLRPTGPISFLANGRNRPASSHYAERAGNAIQERRPANSTPQSRSRPMQTLRLSWNSPSAQNRSGPPSSIMCTARKVMRPACRRRAERLLLEAGLLNERAATFHGSRAASMPSCGNPEPSGPNKPSQYSALANVSDPLPSLTTTCCQSRLPFPGRGTSGDLMRAHLHASQEGRRLNRNVRPVARPDGGQGCHWARQFRALRTWCY